MAYFANKFRTTITDSKPDPKPKKAKKPINKVSKKHGSILRQYVKAKKEFLSRSENKKCFIDNCKRKPNTIEHTRGKVGYYDAEARQKDIPLYLDERFWKPCCLQHNSELESNYELSHKYQKSKLHKGGKND